MRIESRLCHLTENKAIVQVNAWHNDQKLGSALAEGQTVEVAEDKAISRLNKRLNEVTNNEISINSIEEDEIKTDLKVELTKSEKIEKINIKNEPCDWSNELTAIDSEIKRLKWSRDDEIKYLEKTLGYNNRNKITNYNEIVKYLNFLKKISNQDISQLGNKNIDRLIDESENIIRELSWSNLQGRQYLQKEFNVSTRRELNEKQLISFVEKLKSIRNQYINN